MTKKDLWSMQDRQLDADARALLDALSAAGGPALEDLAPAEAREKFTQGRDLLAAEPEIVGSIEDLTAEHQGRSIAYRIYRPIGCKDDLPALVYFHGGGWVLGDLDSQDPLCRKLCNASGAVIVSAQYGHAPEQPFPAAIDDGMAAFDYVCTHARALRIDPQRIGVGGESAGGTIAAVVAQAEVDRGSRRAIAQLLLYPVTDLTRPDDEREPRDGYFVTARMLRWFIDLYLAGADPADVRASPLLKPDLRGLPPTVMVLCGFDPLLREGVDYQERLIAAGVAVTTRFYPGQIHAFLTMDRLIPEAHAALVEIAGLLRRALVL